MKEKKTVPFVRNTIDGLFGNKVIPFSGISLNGSFNKNEEKSVLSSFGNETPGSSIQRPVPVGHLNRFLARPGEKLPESIPDFRLQLQRDGLILLSWVKKINQKRPVYTAYWVTSSGILRYYASPALYIEDFVLAMPNRKSYAAEDGIDFYGDPGPEYIVHVAPELMMSSSVKQNQRPEHIKKLKALGIEIDFNYPFLLTTERKKKHPDHGNQQPRPEGTGYVGS
jgi:hypothetical protein